LIVRAADMVRQIVQKGNVTAQLLRAPPPGGVGARRTRITRRRGAKGARRINFCGSRIS
jgi:hypothetical protein